ncbi:MAG: primosomal protein N' [Clostridia bacterium]|nr:primosomal protein N' [Clostridia bacterium]
MEKAYVSVHILDAGFRLDREYSYFLPPELRDRVRKGTLLVVPFGVSNKQVSAVAVGFSEESGYKRIKTVLSVLDYPFDIPEEFTELCRFMKERFFCSFGQAFRTMLPPGVNLDTEVYYTLTEKEPPEDMNQAAFLLYRRIRTEKESPKRKLLEEFGDEADKMLDSLCGLGLLERKTRVRKQMNEKTVTVLKLCGEAEEIFALLEEGSTLTEKQKVLVELLTHYPCATMREVSEIGGISSSVVSALVRKGIVRREEIRVERNDSPEEVPHEQAKETVLSEEQQTAVDTLKQLSDAEDPKAALLYGVTGSGKTKVIIETVKHVLSKGQTAIILLPEIGLTAQAMGNYRKVFGKELSVIHSMLSVGERLDAFRAMREGKIKVVLGTRSAVFSPLENLGLIVIDEEQEGTYKSELSPKYHARDIARFRCARNKGLLLLASATPSVESFYKAVTGVYTLIKLTKRYGNAKLPKVLIEDLRNDGKIFPEKLVGSRLEAEMLRATGREKQTILFVNRRGYHSHTSCHSCGKVYVCPHCSVSLTYHKYDGARAKEGWLACHYCGYICRVPESCDECGSKHINHFGFGTQKLQDELESRFPALRTLRMDADTTTEKLSYEKILASFGNREADVLFGTQMVSKGFDFPAVELVGVISVDGSLYQNDFRAGERTFSLVTQLVGRAGRSGDNGLAVLQTYNPDNEILNLAAKQDYEAFYNSEIALRRAVAFPPFCSVMVFGFSAPEEKECAAFAKGFDTLFEQIKESKYPHLKIQKFGPYPGGIYKIGGRFRQKIIVKYSDNAVSRSFFGEVYEAGLAKCPKNVRLDADANPTVI